MCEILEIQGNEPCDPLGPPAFRTLFRRPVNIWSPSDKLVLMITFAWLGAREAKVNSELRPPFPRGDPVCRQGSKQQLWGLPRSCRGQGTRIGWLKEAGIHPTQPNKGGGRGEGRWCQGGWGWCPKCRTSMWKRLGAGSSRGIRGITKGWRRALRSRSHAGSLGEPSNVPQDQMFPPKTCPPSGRQGGRGRGELCHFLLFSKYALNTCAPPTPTFQTDLATPS